MQQKLKQRIITGIILIPAVVLALMFLSPAWLALVLAIIATIGAWEWASLVAYTGVSRMFYVFACVVLFMLGWFYLDQHLVRTLMLAASGYWVLILMLLSFYQSNWIGNYLLRSFLSFSGYLVIFTGWLSMVTLHKQDPSLLLFMFVLIWVADTGAYFSGKAFGKTQLAAALSPGKTREGLLGAITGTTLFAILGVWWFELHSVQAVYFIILCVLSALISVVGDLFESLIKRNAGKKDSGTIIPGHGGILDRIDSLLAAAPGFALGIYWLQ